MKHTLEISAIAYGGAPEISRIVYTDVHLEIPVYWEDSKLRTSSFRSKIIKKVLSEYLAIGVEGINKIVIDVARLTGKEELVECVDHHEWNPEIKIVEQIIITFN